MNFSQVIIFNLRCQISHDSFKKKIFVKRLISLRADKVRSWSFVYSHMMMLFPMVRHFYIKSCYDWNVCFILKLICWGLILDATPFGGWAFGRWLRHDSAALMKGISALSYKKRHEKDDLSLQSLSLTLSLSLCTIAGYNKTFVCKPGRATLSGPKLAGTWPWTS